MTDRPERTATFIQVDDRFYPANKHATAAGAVLSRRTLDANHMLAVRSLGYTPRLTNGQEICRVDMTA